MHITDTIDLQLRHGHRRLRARITVATVRTGAAVGALLVTLARMAGGARLHPRLARRCGSDSSGVWRFLVGCDATRPILRGSVIATGGGHAPVGLCAMCAAFRAAEQACGHASGAEWQALLREFQDVAGVADYRTHSHPRTFTPWWAR